MKIPQYITLDFETFKIQPRPLYPPKPVGFSIRFPEDAEARYYAWGHPEGNNCSFEEAQAVLQRAWDSELPILGQNMKFDYDVATTHCGMGPLPWHRLHDTMFLLFLQDPHAKTHSLKPSAERYLDMPPEERDAVTDWLMAHQEELRAKGLLEEGENITRSGAGAYIALAPGELVGAYANGDVVRTERLFELLYPLVCIERGMLAAYDRDRELMPILLENERQGVRVDLPGLENMLVTYEAAHEKALTWLREVLNAPELDLNKKGDLAAALDASGQITEWAVTKTGRKSTSKANLTPDRYADPRVAQVVGYCSRVHTCLSTFIRPWLVMARESGGWIYTNWNQVKQNKSDKDAKGTRTGRMSSTPNFQNIPKNLEEKDDGYVHPEFLGLPELPLMRNIIVPDDENSVFLHRDYNQQELRVLGHFEDGLLMERYNNDPTMDVHTFVQEEIAKITGHTYPRSAVKQVNFGIIYGMGLTALALKIGCAVKEAKDLKAAQGRALPGMKSLEKAVKDRGKNDEHITTWGGRHYYSEPPLQKDHGEVQRFDYKLLNYLIQGSAADITKQALINYDKLKKHGRFMVTVHDEINISCPAEHAAEEMALLRRAMEMVPLDVPLISDGKSGPAWGKVKKYEEAPWSRELLADFMSTTL